MCTSVPCQKKKTNVTQARLEIATLGLQVVRATIANYETIVNLSDLVDALTLITEVPWNGDLKREFDQVGACVSCELVEQSCACVYMHVTLCVHACMCHLWRHTCKA